VDRRSHDLGEEALLVSEVLIDGLLGDGGQRGDLVHARAEVAVAEEHRAGRLENRIVLAHRSVLLAGLGHRARSQVPVHRVLTPRLPAKGTGWYSSSAGTVSSSTRPPLPGSRFKTRSLRCLSRTSSWRESRSASSRAGTRIVCGFPTGARRRSSPSMWRATT